MTATTVKTYTKGQVVIPGAIRTKLNIRPGSRLKIFEYQGVIYLIPPVSDAVAESTGWLPESPSLAAEVLKSRKNK